MIVYIGCVIFTIFLSLLLKNQNVAGRLQLSKGRFSGDKLIIFVIALVLIFIAGVRYRVGADYGVYALSYRGYCSAELELRGEPGIRIVARIASYVYDDYTTMIFLMSWLTIGLFISGIAKCSPLWVVSILLYIFLGCWHESFNSVRQSAAAAVLFWGHQNIRDRKLLHWLLVCFVASLFHVSAVVFVPLYWMPVKQIGLIKVGVFFFVGIVLAFSYDTIWDLIGILQDKEFVIDEYSKNHINVFRIIVAWVPIIFYFLFIRRVVSIEDQSNINFYATFSAFSAAIMLAARFSAYLGRMVIYTDIYNAIFWAYMFTVLLKRRHDMSIKVLLIQAVMLCYFIYYLFEASGEYIANYQTIF